jgi:hypothetical protein
MDNILAQLKEQEIIQQNLAIKANNIKKELKELEVTRGLFETAAAKADVRTWIAEAGAGSGAESGPRPRAGSVP